MIKNFLAFIFLLFSLTLYSQDARPPISKNQNYLTQKKYDYSQYRGAVQKIATFKKCDILLRERTYGESAIQTTLIVRFDKFDFRAYAYFNYFKYTITPALSIRISI